MTVADARREKARIGELRELLRRADVAYYVDNRPFLADSEYDRLLKELAGIEARHPDLDDPNSPTRRVGGAASEGFETAAHRVPMRSIDNSYDEADVRAWCESQLTGYKRPKLIEFRTELPKTAVGKILRRELRG